MNWLKAIVFFGFSMTIQNCFGQSILMDDAYDFELLKSGAKKVRVLKNSGLTEVWVIDSAKYSIIKFIEADFAVNHLPSNFKELAVSSIVRSKFHPFGGVDSIINITCNNSRNLDDSDPHPKRCDTSYFHYTYAGSNLAVNRKKYRIDKGRS